jgi:hypothetical protein
MMANLKGMNVEALMNLRKQIDQRFRLRFCLADKPFTFFKPMKNGTELRRSTLLAGFGPVSGGFGR